MKNIDLTEVLAAARGEVPADIVLKGGCIFNSFTGEWEIGDVAIVGETIAGIGSYSGKKEIDVTGKYVTPGFMDSHLHIESTMVAPRELAKILLLNGVTPLNCRRCCLATDDRHLDELVSEGSINYLIEIGTAHGYPVEQLLQMATLNTAERFRLYDRGALAPGYKADICVFNNLVNFQPQLVLKNGVVIVNKQKLL